MTTQKTLLINIEGIDCSGKTTIAKSLAKKLKLKFEHEPRFSSAEADMLNFGKINHYQREFYFMQDRMRHQITLATHDVVLDSYILRSLTYASYFGPKALQMVRSIYQLPEFKIPDVVVVIDIEPKTAHNFNMKRKGTKEYEPKFTIDVLKGLRACLLTEIDEMKKWKLHPPIEIVQNLGGDMQALKELVETKVRKHIPELKR